MKGKNHFFKKKDKKTELLTVAHVRGDLELALLPDAHRVEAGVPACVLVFLVVRNGRRRRKEKEKKVSVGVGFAFLVRRIHPSFSFVLSPLFLLPFFYPYP